MAKTTSQIVAENKKKRAEEAKIQSSRNEIHKKQMAGVAETAHDRTYAILEKAYSGTTDPGKKSNVQGTIGQLEKLYSSNLPKKPKTATQMQKKKEDRMEAKKPVDSLQIKKDRAGKALSDFDENAEYDWTDTNSRQKYEAERQRLKDAVDMTGAELAQREDARVRQADMDEINAMSEDDRAQLEQYIQSRDTRQSVFGNANTIGWFLEHQKEKESQNALSEKYGEERVKQLAETYSAYLKEQEAQKIVSDTQTAVDKGGMSEFGQNLLGVLTKFGGSVEGAPGRLAEKANSTGRYENLSAYTTGDLLSLHGSTVTGRTAQNIAGDEYDENGQKIKDGGMIRQGLSYGYQGVSSLVDSLVRTFFGGGAAGGAALAASGSFSQAVSDATKQGATKEQAVMMGVATAGMEYVTEKIPMDEVFKTAKAGNMKVLTEALKQAGIEATTEELSLFGTMAAEAAILQEKSSYKQQIGDLVASGMSYDEAKAQANRNVWEEVKQTAIVSGISGGISGGGAAYVGNQQNAVADISEGAEIQQETAQQPVEAPVAVQQEQQVQTPPVNPMEAVAEQLVQQYPQEQAPPKTKLQQDLDRAAEAAINGTPIETVTAPAESNAINNDTAGKEYVSLEDYANKESPVWRNVEYEDENTKTAIMQDTHQKMVDSGAVVKVDAGVMENVEQSYPDLRGVKKKERTPILKQAITTLKNNLRQYLGGISNQSFEFEVNGKILEAKLYNTGINEVLEKVTKEKAGMLYSSEEVFRNARYLYSTPDYDGDPKVFRWNYFYTPVQIGNDVVGVRIAVRDMAIPRESQIYNWNIKKDTSLDGVGRGMNPVSSNGVSSDVSTDSIPQSPPVVNQNQPDFKTMSEEDFLNSMGENSGAAESNPFADRSWHEVGKRSEKAFMAQHPEVKKLFQNEAAILYGELGDSIKGERTFNGDAYYQSGGESGWSGNKRYTSEGIADLLDSGFTYDQIEKGLMSIMEDHGAENNAASKRIEFIINDRLLNGYTSFYDGSRVAPNADYAAFANGQSTQYTDTQNLSAESGHGFEAMGAASANFTEKPAYNATLSEENRQADRRDDARPMELPKTDVQGNPVSATTGNAYGSRITPDDFASLMEEPVARGDFSYMKITNDKATQMAAETIGRSTTWEDAFEQWTKEVDRGVAGAEISARGALFLNRAAQSGDKQQYLSVLHNIQRLGTNTAQGLQAMRLIRSLNPPDKIEFIKLTVDRMASDLKLGNRLEIDEKLLAKYDNAKTDKARDAVVEEIQQNVASQIPSTFMDKFTALRYVNMLGNLKTNVRNVAGNVASNLMYKVKDGVATGIEAMTHKLTGAERTKAFTVSRDLLKACKEDFTQVSGIVGDGGKYGDKMSAYSEFTQGVMDKRRIFKNPLMEGYRKATNWAMNNGKFGDEAFGRAAYSRALAGYLEINGMSAKEFKQIIETGKGNTSLVDRARAYAVQQAQEMTFHDNSAMARIMSNLQKAGGPVVGQGIMPFTKTPANVLTRAEEFSPLGFINSTVKSIQKARGDVNISGADLIDSWSKNMTGTGIFALGAYLMGQGMLTGAADDDEEKAAFDRMNGVQEYALKLPDRTSYTIDWLTPAAMPLFMGAELMKVIEEDGELNFSDLEGVLTSIGDPMIQMSMMQGINDSLDNIKYANNNLGQFVLNAGLNYLLQGFSNTALGQIERSTEKNRTTTYVDKNSGVPVWMQKELGKLSQKIPGWDYQQTDYLDAWGQEQKNEGGLAYNLLSPGYLSKEKTSQINDELYRLHESTGENVFPQSTEKTVTYTDTSGAAHQDYNLSAEEFAVMQKEERQTADRLLSEIVGNKDYNALTDAQRVAVLADVYKYAREQGRKAALPDYYSEASSWIRNMGKDTANAIIQRAALGEVNSAVVGAVDNLENGWNVTEAGRKELDNFYNSFNGMSKEAQAKILEEAVSDTARYLEMRSNGVSTDKYLEVVGDVKRLKPEPNYSDVRDIQILEAIARSKNLTEKEIDIVMRAYMPDYDPKAKSPQTTELKYNAIRGLGVSPKGYADAYRDYLDASGSGKRKRTIAQYQKDYGWDRATATKVYDIYAGYWKPWTE